MIKKPLFEEGDIVLFRLNDKETHLRERVEPFDNTACHIDDVMLLGNSYYYSVEEIKHTFIRESSFSLISHAPTVTSEEFKELLEA